MVPRNGDGSPILIPRPPADVLLHGARVRIVGAHPRAGHAGRVVRIEKDDPRGIDFAYRIALDGAANDECVAFPQNVVPLLGGKV